MQAFVPNWVVFFALEMPSALLFFFNLVFDCKHSLGVGQNNTDFIPASNRNRGAGAGMYLSNESTGHT
jgi:hypothetical protein